MVKLTMVKFFKKKSQFHTIIFFFLQAEKDAIFFNQSRFGY